MQYNYNYTCFAITVHCSHSLLSVSSLTFLNNYYFVIIKINTAISLFSNLSSGLLLKFLTNNINNSFFKSIKSK